MDRSYILFFILSIGPFIRGLRLLLNQDSKSEYLDFISNQPKKKYIVLDKKSLLITSTIRYLSEGLLLICAGYLKMISMDNWLKILLILAVVNEGIFFLCKYNYLKRKEIQIF